MDAVRRLFWLHDEPAGPLIPLWDEWRPKATLWPRGMIRSSVGLRSLIVDVRLVGTMRQVAFRREMQPEVFDHPLMEALIHDRFGRHVGEPAEREELERLARAEEGVGEFHAVLEVDVVVGGAVDEEEFALKAVGVGEDVAVAVAGDVFRGEAEVAFGVVGVVVGPIDDGGARDAGAEEVGALQDRHGGEVAAERPAVDADATEIHFRMLGG